MVRAIVCLLLVGISYIVGFCTGASWIFKRNFEFTKRQCERGDKFVRMFLVLNHWFQLEKGSEDIALYLKKMNFNSIAIYGLGYLGKHLVREIQGSEINIDYAIDKKIEVIGENITIYKPNDSLPATDAIVVTAIMEFDCISDALGEKVGCPIISLENMISELPVKK